MSSEQELHQNLLAGFIKEDRAEIRIIKDRIYTAIQIFIGAAFAIVAFFMKENMDSNGNITLTCDVKKLIILINGALLLTSWIIFYFQNKDLHFVRRCMEKREKKLKKINKNYFPHVSCEMDQDFKCWFIKCLLLIPWLLIIFAKKFWPTKFKNDGLLVIPMLLLTLIYILTTIGAVTLF